MKPRCCLAIAVGTLPLLLAPALPVSAQVVDDTLTCFRNNEFPVESSGPFRASSRGSGKGEAEIETPNGDGTIVDRPDIEGVGVSWNVTETVTENGGTPFTVTPAAMSGVLTLVITWPVSTGLKPTKFTSGCIQEAGIDAGEIEAEFEGVVERWPVSGMNDPRHAVGTFHAKKNADNPRIVDFQVSIELRRTCDEGAFGVDEHEVNITGKGSGNVNLSDTGIDALRANLPDGVTPQNDPCFGVTFVDPE